MTWLQDVQQDRPDDVKRTKLLAEREGLVKQVEALGRTVSFKTEAAKRFHLEDLTALAKKIANIDKKLGR